MTMMQAKKPTSGLLALLLMSGFAGLVAVPTVAAEGCTAETPWYSTSGDMECGWSCESGQTFGVSGNADGDVWGAAECGGGNGACSGHKQCVPYLYGTAGSSGSGDCYGNGKNGYLQCAAGHSSGLDFGALEKILEMIINGGRCVEIQHAAPSAGVSSLIVMAIDDFGFSSTFFVWNSGDACEGEPSEPGEPGGPHDEPYESPVGVIKRAVKEFLDGLL
jgi:hypothetical protein